MSLLAVHRAAFAAGLFFLLVWIACLLAGAIEIAIVPFIAAIPFLLVFAATGVGAFATTYRSHVREGFSTARCKVCGVDVPRGDAVCSPEHLEEHEARTAW